MSFDDYKIFVQEQENFYNSTESFGSNDGFFFAGGVVAFDGSSAVITDVSIGQVKFYYKSWSASIDEDHDMFEEIPTSFCTPEVF